LAQAGKSLTLDADAVAYRTMFIGRMSTAGLRKSPHQGFIQGIEKKYFDAVASCTDFFKGALVAFEKLAATNICNQNNALEGLARFTDQIDKTLEETQRKIIDTVISLILKGSDCR